jgi:hypothetical protein
MYVRHSKRGLASPAVANGGSSGSTYCRCDSDPLPQPYKVTPATSSLSHCDTRLQPKLSHTHSTFSTPTETSPIH